MVVSLRANLFSSGLGGSFLQPSQRNSTQRVGSEGTPSTPAAYSRLRDSDRDEGLAVRSINESISLVNVAKGALDEISSILERQQELAELGSDELLSDTQRAAIDAENTDLQAEYTRILEETEFNGTQVFSGELGGVSVQAGEQTLRLNFALSPPEQTATSLATASASAAALTILQSLEEELNVSRVQVESSNTQIGSFIQGIRTQATNDIDNEDVLNDIEEAEQLAAEGALTIVADPEVALAAQANIQADIVLASLTGEEEESSLPSLSSF